MTSGRLLIRRSRLVDPDIKLRVPIPRSLVQVPRAVVRSARLVAAGLKPVVGSAQSSLKPRVGSDGLVPASLKFRVRGGRLVPVSFRAGVRAAQVGLFEGGLVGRGVRAVFGVR